MRDATASDTNITAIYQVGTVGSLRSSLGTDCGYSDGVWTTTVATM